MQVFNYTLGTKFFLFLLSFCITHITHFGCSSDTDVVVRHDLCDEEKSFIQKRLQRVDNCLRSHGIVCKRDALPRVALLGSGGGQRAQIAFLGVLEQLGQDNLLDCFLYLAGVSGSTWAMSSLYDDPNWSKNVTDVTSRILWSMSVGKGVTFSEGVQWLRERNEEGDMSLSDFWGVLVSSIKGVPLETRTLSAEGKRDKDGANPYPLYSVSDRKFFNENDVKEVWFELSPNEAGFTELGAFVKTSLLKKQFDGGHVKQGSKRKPMDMVQLQGICGSIMGDEKNDRKYIKTYFLHWIHSHWSCLQNDSMPTAGAIQIVIALVDLVEWTDDMKRSHEVLVTLKALLGDDYGLFSPALQELDYEIWTNMKDQERKQHIGKIFEELIESSEDWGQDLNKLNNIFSDVWWLVKHILPLFHKWQFGNIANFLYRFHDPMIPKEMGNQNTMHLMDAGLFLNSAYPPVLRKEREIDIIVSFDFSEDAPFETLKGASDYAATIKRPFPKIDIMNLDHNCPKSFYVFEEKGKPTVIHFPVFNIDNCKNESTINEEWREYATFQMAYRGEQKINHLANLAMENVRMNKDGILTVVQKAAERRNDICQFLQDMHTC